MISFAIIGAGDRARKLMEFARRNPARVTVTAVADPNAVHRNRMAQTFGIPDSRCFTDWKELLAQDKIADAMLIATPDRLHYEPAMRSLDKGYHLLLEKPIACTLEHCTDIAAKARDKGLLAGVCHVMRYFPSYCKGRELILGGAVGKVISINHREAVGIDRMLHSFVRGIWNNSDTSNPMILSKCCHDLDMLVWITGGHAQAVSSFGSLDWFKAENAPAGSTLRCIDCPIEKECRFSAVDIYLRRHKWLRHFDKTDDRSLTEMLHSSPYGLCAYRCGNNVVDHQVVSFKLQGGAVVNLAMDVFSNEEGRETHIMGSQGEIKIWEEEVEYTHFMKGTTRYQFDHLPLAGEYHYGADLLIVEDFVKALEGGNRASFAASIEDSIEGHRIAFEAEQARLKWR